MVVVQVVSFDDGMFNALILDSEVNMSLQSRSEPKDKVYDLQTISVFVVLAVLTGLFVVGLRWALGGA